MPRLYIPSLYDRRKRKYGGEIKHVRQDLADFLAAYEAETGPEAASVIRAYAAVPRKYFLNDDDKQTDNQDAFGRVRRLATREAQFLKKLHSPACFYHDREEPPYVLWCYGISWDDLRRMLGDEGRLPLEHVLRLLDALGSGKAVREVVVGWERVFRRRRQRLVRLLLTAAKLEEAVVFRFPSTTILDLSDWLIGQPNPEEETR